MERMKSLNPDQLQIYIIIVYKLIYIGSFHKGKMYNDLSEEDVILLAIEYVFKGVNIPSGVVDRLGSKLIDTIKENA